jgi:NTP pyrophosphatase (non-canonical NTP hydrolase)
METPRDIVREYYLQKDIKFPEEAQQALAYLIAEVGELSAALHSAGGVIKEETTYPFMVMSMTGLGAMADILACSDAEDWTRYEQRDMAPTLEDEIGDVLMALIVLASHFGVDPLDCMINTMKKRGMEI